MQKLVAPAPATSVTSPLDAVAQRIQLVAPLLVTSHRPDPGPLAL